MRFPFAWQSICALHLKNVEGIKIVGICRHAFGIFRQFSAFLEPVKWCAFRVKVACFWSTPSNLDFSAFWGMVICRECEY